MSGPSSAPPGSVTVLAGDNSHTTLNDANTTYWFAPGVHTLGTSEFGQIIPSNGDTYIGGLGAIINGQDKNDFAFTQQATNVTVKYLTIENFVAAQDQGVVNHDSGTGWIVANDTIEGTLKGAGLMLGSDSVTTNDCLTDNGQYGFNGYSAAGDVNLTLTDNEISFNDSADYDLPGGPGGDGCGCAGGGKFWATNGATVTGNYVHDNNDPGLWADTDNTGFDISNNYIAHNGAQGIMYEISYNANITNNTLIDNGWQAGPDNPGFPTAALYVSESGGDSRVPGAYSGQFNVTGNVFTDNWGGVVLWENSNRFCSDGWDDVCTLVNPSVDMVASCGTHLATSTPTSNPDYFDDCRWKTQNVSVSDNTFNFNPADIGAACTESNACGFTGLFSEFGSSPPYQAWIVPENISNNQNNHFRDNTYSGPWRFDGFEQGDVVTSAQWSAGFNDVNGSNDHFNSQDAGSTFAPEVGTTYVPVAPLNAPYQQTLTANGGTAPYTWSIQGGTLPLGLSLAATTGVISGTPTVAGAQDVTFEVTDHAGVVSNPVTLTIAIVAPAPFTPLVPVRICDSRTVSTFVPPNQCDSGAGNPVGPLSAGGTKAINVANAGDGGLGTFGVPADATSVDLNVTAVNPSAPGGFMSVWPAGASQPNTSNLNYPTGETVPNLVQVGVGSSGDISFFSSDQTDLIVDVEGYSAPPQALGTDLKGAILPDSEAGLYNALPVPSRLCDTRAPSTFTPANQCDGPDNAAGTLAANMAKNVTVTAGSVLNGATAAVLNITVVNPAIAGFLTAYPQGSSAPNTSNLNFGAGQTTTNRVIVPLSASGQISLVSSARADAIVDVSGYFTAAGGTGGGEFSPESAPARICDTRTASSFSPQNQCSGEHVASGTSHELSLKVINGGAVSDGVPADATAVVVNLTGVTPSATTFLTVFPGGITPNSSDLNPAAGATRANLVVATVNPETGRISVFNDTGSLDVVVDVLGWYS